MGREGSAGVGGIVHVQKAVIVWRVVIHAAAHAPMATRRSQQMR